MLDNPAEAHKQVRQYRPPAFADFMDLIFLHMTPAERRSLPDETFAYINAIMTFAMEHLSEFSEDMVQMVAGVYVQSPGGERFVQDPTRWNSITEAALFLDSDGQLVTVRNPKLVRESVAGERSTVLVMKDYQSYEVLTGPLAGKRYDSHSRPLPAEPVHRPGVILGSTAAALPLAAGADKPKSTESPRLRIFLCHAHEDIEAVRSLYDQLRQSGFDPWLDKENLVPGQDWDLEITRAVRAAHIVLICVSQHLEKRGYVQKEVKRALDVADEQPEGTIFLIPVRLEECNVPERLNRWQWVDLFKPDGYTRLEVALNMAAKTAAK